MEQWDNGREYPSAAEQAQRQRRQAYEKYQEQQKQARQIYKAQKERERRLARQEKSAALYTLVQRASDLAPPGDAEQKVLCEPQTSARRFR